MAHKSRSSGGRRSSPEDDDRRSRNPARKNTSPVPFIAFLVLIASAIGVAGWMKGQQKTPAEAASKAADPSGYVPFASVPKEQPPMKGNTPSFAQAEEAFGGVATVAPEGVLAESVWTAASATAALADAAFAEAMTAKEAGDSALFQKKGKEAKKLYEQALDSTEAWVEKLSGEYGEADRQVSAVRRARKPWRERQVTLHKLTGI